jgi:hypothetical protein
MNGLWKPGVIALPTAAGRMASICPDVVILTVIDNDGRTVAVKVPNPRRENRSISAKRTTAPAQFTPAAGKFQAAAARPFTQSI